MKPSVSAQCTTALASDLHSRRAQGVLHGSDAGNDHRKPISTSGLVQETLTMISFVEIVDLWAHLHRQVMRDLAVQ